MTYFQSHVINSCPQSMENLKHAFLVAIIVLHVAYMDPALNVKDTLNKRILPRKPISS